MLFFLVPHKEKSDICFDLYDRKAKKRERIIKNIRKYKKKLYFIVS